MKMHLSLPVLNIEKTNIFYSKLFSENPIKIKNDYLKFDPKGIALNLSFHLSGQKISKFPHLGIELSDLEVFSKTFESLKNKEMIELEQDESTCCYAAQKKFWVKDPSGYRWEIYYIVKDTEQKMSPNSKCCEVSSDESVKNCC